MQEWDENVPWRGTRICKGQVGEKIMVLWRNERKSVYLVSECDGWRWSQRKDIIRNEDLGKEVWLGLNFKGWGNPGKYLESHYPQWEIKMGFMQKNNIHFHFGCSTVMAGKLGSDAWRQRDHLECYCGPVGRWRWSELRFSREQTDQHS